MVHSAQPPGPRSNRPTRSLVRRVCLAPGVTLNLSKSTAKLSFGPRGAKYTVNPRGNRSTVGIRGTGLFYTVQDRKSAAARSAPGSRDKLSLGLFRRLATPPEEKALVDDEDLVARIKAQPPRQQPAG